MQTLGRAHLVAIPCLLASLGALSAVVVPACSPPRSETRESVGGESPDLIGGTAQSAQGTSALYIRASGQECSAVMIGRNLVMTAAHCVTKLVPANPATGTPRQRFPDVIGEYGDGKPIRFTNSPSVTNASNWFDTAIVKTEVHPSIKSNCASGCERFTYAPFPPDLAIIVLRDNFPSCFGLPAIPVTAKTDEVVIESGFGCEDTAIDGAPYTPRYKTAKDKVVDPTGSMPASFDITDTKAFGKSYYVLLGQSSGGVASICPGDSGGPLFKGSMTNGGYLAGINADYRFPGTSGVSDVNIFSRLDSDGTDDWITQVRLDHPPAKGTSTRGMPINEGSDPIASSIPRSTVRIQTTGTNGCTGVIIAPTKVLTAGHCKIDDSTTVLFYPATPGAGAKSTSSTTVVDVASRTGTDCDPTVTDSFPATCAMPPSTVASSPIVYADLQVLTLASAVPPGYVPVDLAPSGTAPPSAATTDDDVAWQVGAPSPNGMQWAPAYDVSGVQSDGSFRMQSVFGLRSDSGGPLFQLVPKFDAGGNLPPLRLLGIASDIGPCPYLCATTCDVHVDRFTSVTQPDNYAWIVDKRGPSATDTFGASK
jgi:hypothetical protein